MSASVPLRRLGASGPLVPALGFGALSLSTFYGATEPSSERFKVLDRAYELHARHWDTSDMYGDSEELIGEWFRRTGKRSEIFLATKFGVVGMENGSIKIRSAPEYVRESCERSLQRLGVDCIDLYYCHRVDEKTPIELTVRAMVNLKREGKIKYLGFSELSAASLHRAHAEHPISALQMEYSPFTLDIESRETGILKAARSLGIALVAYSPLGRGFMSGKYKSPDDFDEGDFRRTAPRFSKENFPKDLKLVEAFGDLAEKKDCTPAQLCLAWLMAQGDDIFLIPGTKKVKYLEENMGTIGVTLTQQEIAALRKIADEAEVAGSRVPQTFTSSLYANTPALNDLS
ncbi:NADP-dependent oxidoreductase domain-containing protein [Xylogone sp. PMI_703]|nr:NADP-dependent oxidoreductase domain-containing protein [Xylogone sp. PMI_703]